MKNKRTFLFILSFSIAFLLYRTDFTVATAAQQNMEAAGQEPEGSIELIEPAAGSEAEEPEKPEESAVGLEAEDSEESAESVVGSEAEEPEKPEESVVSSEAEEPEEPAESIVGSEPEEAEGSIEPSAVSETKEPAEPAVESGESVSTGQELLAWLAAHKNSGGTVRLADHIVLDGNCGFYPNAAYMPTLTVDTDHYTITVTGETELLSDNRLIFSGRPDGRAIFYVAQKGMLSMHGITVESGGGALWQEEGAGLVVSDCRISGSVHYADTPFVTYYRDSICAVVERGQTVEDALPAQINCTVNRQGKLNGDERLSVSWNLEGTEKQQEERKRFRIHGSFLQAASAESASCTVVYNDYPLTFTDVRAEARGRLYTFQGGFTVPEEHLPFVIRAEYSFDGESWLLFEEQNVKTADAGFYIACKDDRDGAESCSNIYIRLQWNHNGTRYFSNVLCYAADDLDAEEDIGGSRGGGTSITNPPDEPKEETGPPPGEEKPKREPGSGTSPDKGSTGQADEELANSGAISGSGDPDGNTGQPLYEKTAEGDAGELSGAESSNMTAERTADMKSETADGERALQGASTEAGKASAPHSRMSADNRTSADDGKNTSHSDYAAPEAVETVSAHGENGAGLTQEQSLPKESRRAGHMALAAGFVLFAALAGAAGFYARSRYS